MQVIYKGKAIDVPDSHARRLVQAGRANWPKSAERPKVEKDESAEDPKATTSKRAYKRRDMKAGE